MLDQVAGCCNEIGKSWLWGVGVLLSWRALGASLPTNRLCDVRARAEAPLLQVGICCNSQPAACMTVPRQLHEAACVPSFWQGGTWAACFC
jgi:hypothetical protein